MGGVRIHRRVRRSCRARQHPWIEFRLGHKLRSRKPYRPICVRRGPPSPPSLLCDRDSPLPALRHRRGHQPDTCLPVANGLARRYVHPGRHRDSGCVSGHYRPGLGSRGCDRDPRDRRALQPLADSYPEIHRPALLQTKVRCGPHAGTTADNTAGRGRSRAAESRGPDGCGRYASTLIDRNLDWEREVMKRRLLSRLAWSLGILGLVLTALTVLLIMANRLADPADALYPLDF